MSITGKSMEPSTWKPQRMQAFLLFGLVRDACGYSALNGISLHRACILKVLFMNFIKCILFSSVHKCILFIEEQWRPKSWRHHLFNMMHTNLNICINGGLEKHSTSFCILPRSSVVFALHLHIILTNNYTVAQGVTAASQRAETMCDIFYLPIPNVSIVYSTVNHSTDNYMVYKYLRPTTCATSKCSLPWPVAKNNSMYSEMFMCGLSSGKWGTQRYCLWRGSWVLIYSYTTTVLTYFVYQ